MRIITIASLNTFGGSLNLFGWKDRYKAITNHFLNSDADVIQFQEVFTYYHLGLFKNLLKAHPYCIYKKSYFGPKGGLTTFSRHPLININHIGYSRHFVPYLGKSIIELPTQRGMLCADIENLGVSLINTHLTAVLNANWTKNSKYYKELSSEIEEFHKVLEKIDSKKITIASGDFNIAKNSELFKELISPNLLYDPFETNLEATRHQEFVPRGRNVNRVDYIFIRGAKNIYSVTDKRHLFVEKVPLNKDRSGFASDHIGLQVSLKI